MKVWRNGAEQTLGVTVGKMQEEKVASAEDTSPSANSGKLGLTVQQSDQGLVVADASGPAARGDDQNRDALAAPAQAFEQREPVLLWQAEIEQHERVRRLGSERRFGGCAVLHPVDHVAVLAQRRAHARADHHVVFYE
jgi:hypothetical protein